MCRSAWSEPAAQWCRLALGVAVIWAMVFVVAPGLARVGLVRRLHECLRRSDIDATALFYTDVEEFGDAEAHVRDALAH